MDQNRADRAARLFLGAAAGAAVAGMPPGWSPGSLPSAARSFAAARR